MAEFGKEDLSGSTFDWTDLSGSTFNAASLSNVRIRATDLHHVRMSGVELYDVVTVDTTDVRVVGITEEWDRGSLRQRLELGEVNTLGIYQG